MLLVLLACVLAVSACGGQSGGWRDTDVCQLLAKAQVARLLNVEAQGLTARSSDEHNRPQCVWGAGQRLTSGKYEYEFKVQLWQPPVPKPLKQASERVFRIGDFTAYVGFESHIGCFMNVAGKSAWIQVDSNSRSQLGVQRSDKGCDRAARLVHTVITKLGW